MDLYCVKNIKNPNNAYTTKDTIFKVNSIIVERSMWLWYRKTSKHSSFRVILVANHNSLTSKQAIKKSFNITLVFYCKSLSIEWI